APVAPTAQEYRTMKPDPIITSPDLPAGVTFDQAAQWPKCPEAARLANVSVRTLKRRIKARSVRAYVVAGIVRVDPQSLADAVQPAEPATTERPPRQTSANARQAARPEPLGVGPRRLRRATSAA